MDGGYWVGGTEYVAAADKDICSGADEAWGRFVLHATVYLDEGVRLALVDELAQTLRLVDGLLDELLTSEARVDAHQEDEVDIADNILEHAHRCSRIKGHSGLHAGIVYFLHCAVEVGARLVVDSHEHGSSLGRSADVTFGLNDHVVHIKRFLTDFPYGLQNRETEGYVGYEDTVHDVHVEPLGFTAVDHIDIGLQVGEVGRQQRGGNNC